MNALKTIQSLKTYKPVLWMLAFLGLFGINGVFLYYVIFHPDIVQAANNNPVSLVFMIEAFLLTFVGAWLIKLSSLESPGWLAFILMSFAGSLAFSLPFFLLLHLKKLDRN